MDHSVNDSVSGIVQYFFEPNETYWPFIAFLIALSIFSVWTLRSALDIVSAVVTILVYGIISIVTTRFKFRRIDCDREGNVAIFFYRRSGVSWKTIVQTLLGAAIPLLLTWFVIFNISQGSDDLPELVMLIGMLLYIGIIPITPALAANSKLHILKTTVFAKVDLKNYNFLEFQMNINPLDGYWYEQREDSEFQEGVRNIIVSILKEQESV